MLSKRIFLSSASDEFGTLREKLAAALLRAGINVEHQEIFPHTASDTVRKMGGLIKGCSLLIHIIGDQPGSVASPGAVVDLLDEITPTGFLSKHPDLKDALGDLSGITYTQWEAFLALHLGVPVIVYTSGSACDSGSTTLRKDFAQYHHLERLSLVRKKPYFCPNEESLIANIPADIYRHFGLTEECSAGVTPRYLPERNRYFRGRTIDLVQVGDSLNQFTTIGITQQVAIFASGGMGKSSLALEFAWRCLSSSPQKYPGGVFWCDCRHRDAQSLADNLATLAAPLGISVDESNDTLATARSVNSKLTLGPPSLLILDNIIDTEQWRNKEWNTLLPRGNCHRLLTTRAETLGDHQIPMVSLDRLQMTDARALLHAYRDDIPLEDTDDAVRAIVEWFGGLAIGLTIIGIYLSLHPNITPDAYWKSLGEKKLSTFRDTEDIANPVDYPNRMDSIIDDIFHSQSYAEQQALFYASLLPGDDVSDRWLIELLKDDLANKIIEGKTLPGYPSFSRSVIERLVQRGILVPAIDTRVRKTLFLHQVIRERFRELLQTDHSRSNEIASHIRNFATKNYHRSREWNQAIIESTDFSKAQEIFEAMVETNLDPNVYTFSALLTKADTYEQGREVIIRTEAAGIAPSIVTFNTLLSKADSHEQENEILARIEAARIEPDVVTFSTLLSKVDTYEQGSEILARMETARIEPDIVTFSTLLSKADTYEQGNEILARMVGVGIKPNVVIFTKLLSKANNYEQANDVFARMDAARIEPNIVTFSTLLSKADTYEQGNEILARMVGVGIEPNVVIFTKLLSKADNYEQANDVFTRMVTTNIEPNIFTFNTLLSKAITYAQGNEILTRMDAARIEPNTYTFSSLLSKADTYEQGSETLSLMEAARIEPDIYTFSSLLSKADTYEQRKESLTRMEVAGIETSVATFNISLSMVDTYERANQIFSQMITAQIKPNANTIDKLLSIANTYEEGKDVFARITTVGLKLKVSDYEALFSKPDLPPISKILPWYYTEQPDSIRPLGALIANLQRSNRIEEAMHIALQYPQLKNTQILIYQFPEFAKDFFLTAKESDPRHPTADFALGVQALVVNERIEAKKYLTIAIQQTVDPFHKISIQALINRIKLNRPLRHAQGERRAKWF